MRLTFKNNISQVDFSNIASKIFDFKENLSPAEQFIFDDIVFHCSEDGQVTSCDIQRCLTVLQDFRIIGLKNKTYDHTIIRLVPAEAAAIIQTYDTQIINTLERLSHYLCTA